MSKNTTPMAEAKKVKKSKKPKGNGIEQIIAMLKANKNKIGAIVCAVQVKPGEKIIDDEGDKSNGFVMATDVVSSTSSENHKKVNAHTTLLRGLALEINDRFVSKRGLFG